MEMNKELKNERLEKKVILLGSKMLCRKSDAETFLMYLQTGSGIENPNA